MSDVETARVVAGRTSPTFVRVAALVHVGLAAALGIVRLIGEKTPVVHGAEWWLADLALATILAAPAVLALFASRDRVLLIPAGVLSVGTAMLFGSGEGLPLIVPGVLYLIGYAPVHQTIGVRSSAAAVIPLLAVGAATLLLFSQHHVVCYQETRYADGRTAVTRDRAAERAARSGAFSQTSGPPRAGVVSQGGGCTDGAIRPKGSIGALAMVAGGFAVARITSHRSADER